MIEVILFFEDHGQDFLRWWIKDGEVVASWPFQGSIWSGRKVLTKRLTVRKQITIVGHDGDDLTIRYPIRRIEPITKKTFLCACCGHTRELLTIRGPFRCTMCKKETKERVPTLKEPSSVRAA